MIQSRTSNLCKESQWAGKHHVLHDAFRSTATCKVFIHFSHLSRSLSGPESIMSHMKLSGQPRLVGTLRSSSSTSIHCNFVRFLAFIMVSFNFGIIACALCWKSLMSTKDLYEELTFIVNNHCLYPEETIIKSKYGTIN